MRSQKKSIMDFKRFTTMWNSIDIDCQQTNTGTTAAFLAAKNGHLKLL